VASREAPTHAKVLPAPGLYRHFKGGEYELLSVARHSETEELLAVYRSVEDRDTIWVRSLEMFTEWLSTRTPNCRGLSLCRAAPADPRYAAGWIG
jgi:hypothetical protein